MTRRKKAWLYFFLIVFSLIVLIILLGPPLLEQYLRKQLQKELALNLDAIVTIQNLDIKWFSGEIVVENLLITGKGNFANEKMLSIESFSLRIAENKGFNLASIKLEELLVRNAKIFIITDEQGNKNWVNSQQPGVSSENNSEFSIHKISLENIGIYIEDRQQKIRYSISNCSFNMLTASNSNNVTTIDYNLSAASIHFENTTGNNHIESIILKAHHIRDSISQTITGDLNIAGMQSDVEIQFSNDLSEYMFHLKTHDIPVHDLAIVLAGTNTDISHLGFSGKCQAELRLTKKPSQQEIPDVLLNITADNVLINNKLNGNCISAFCSINHKYETIDGLFCCSKNDSINIASATNRLWFSANTQAGKPEWGSYNASGSFDLDCLNSVFTATHNVFGGSLSGANSGKNQCNIHASAVELHRTTGGNTYSIKNGSFSLSPNREAYHFILTKNASQLAAFNLEITPANIARLIPGNLKTSLNVSKLTIETPSGTNSLGMISPSSEGPIHFGLPYLQSYSIEICIGADSLFYGGAVFSPVSIQYAAASKNLWLQILSKYNNNSFFDAELSIQHSADSVDLIACKANFEHNAADPGTIQGNVSGKINLHASLNDSLKLIEHSMNGSIYIASDSMLIHKRILSGPLRMIRPLIESDYLHVADAVIDCKIRNSQFLINEAKSIVNKWNIQTTGRYEALGEVHMISLLQVKPSKLNYIERNIIKNALKGQSVDYNEIFKRKHLVLQIHTTGNANSLKHKLHIIDRTKRR